MVWAWQLWVRQGHGRGSYYSAAKGRAGGGFSFPFMFVPSEKRKQVDPIRDGCRVYVSPSQSGHFVFVLGGGGNEDELRTSDNHSWKNNEGLLGEERRVVPDY